MACGRPPAAAQKPAAMWGCRAAARSTWRRGRTHGCAPRRSGRRRASNSDVNPTTVGLQELQSPTPRMAALPSAAIFLRISRSSTQLSRGVMTWRLDRRQMLGEPLPQLLHERRGIIEQAIDQIDNLAVEAGRTRRQALAGHFRRIATRIVNAQELGHAFLILLGDNRGERANLDQAPSPYKLGADVRTAHSGLAAIALDLILAPKFAKAARSTA